MKTRIVDFLTRLTFFIGLITVLTITYSALAGSVFNVQRLKDLVPFGSFEKTIPEDMLLNPIIILATLDGRGFCSGTVIDNNYIVTAAHCLYDENHVLRTEKLKIILPSGFDTGIIAQPAGINIELDTGLVLGDFSGFSRMLISFADLPFRTGGPFVACGFPQMQHTLVCGEVFNPRPLWFQFSAQGTLSPGMSGGPVIDLSTGVPIIIAVNTAVMDDRIVLSPVLGMLGTFQIEP